VQPVTLSISGMTCSHCVAAVAEALEQVPGVESAEVSLQSGQAVVRGSAQVQALIDAVKDAGYAAAVRPA
jgi:copper chaperone CopZ